LSSRRRWRSGGGGERGVRGEERRGKEEDAEEHQRE